MSSINGINPFSSGAIQNPFKDIMEQQAKQIDQAKVLLATGYDVTYVTQSTGLTLETVLRLQQEANF